VNRLLKFLSLKKSDRRLLISAVLLLGTIRIGLWLLPFPAWRRLLAQMTTTNKKLQQSVNQVAWAVGVASRFMPGGVKCLARALATQILLAQQGHEAELRIGVAKGEAGQLEAHAWVESGGKVVIGGLKDLGRYTPLPNLEVERL